MSQYTSGKMIIEGDQGSPLPVVIVAAEPVTSNNLVTVPAVTTAVMMLPANNDRKALSIYNASDSILYVKFGTGLTEDFYNFQMPKNSLWESEFYSFNGEIWGLWDEATGEAQISELS